MSTSPDHDTQLLRFSTAGSVDDGKSTLIGRLLHDTKSIFEDQYEAIASVSKRAGLEEVNLALLTDGLKAEREQGITIDVAYRYFATPQRKFIIADTPGHVEYTRNMVTGASTSQLSLILVDAEKGISEQTRRHLFIASLLGIHHVVICINKMDLVDFSAEIYDEIVDQLEAFISKLEIQDVHFIPISALHGDNVVSRSPQTSWYEGPTLLYLLEHIHIGSDHNLIDCRFPVQRVVRPQTDQHHRYRGYAGSVAGGIFKPGDEVMILPSGFTSRIASIDTHDGELQEAFPPQSVTIRLEDDIDVSRGDMIVRPHNQPDVTQDLDIMLCRLNKRPFNPQAKYIIKHTTKETRCIIKQVHYKININTLHRIPDDHHVEMNEIARIRLRTMHPLYCDTYRRNRTTGSLILIDEGTNETVGAGMIL